MNQQKRIDKIIEAVEARIQEEVGGLLGADFTLISGDNAVVSKETAFENRQGKQICALMDITGEITGKGCLLLGIKDAIRLGGTLIMLPSGELEEVIGREEYSEEIEDSYGEIANIIAGSFTKDFEEMYPKSCRFVRKEQDVLVPTKVDIAGDSPVANQAYYQVAASMVLDGRQMGDMIMLLPADIFGLQEQEKEQKKSGESAAPSTEPKAAGQENVKNEAGDSQRQPEVTAEQVQVQEQIQEPQANAAAGPKFNAEKHKKKVNNLLVECQKKVEAEVSALLGVDVTLGVPENKLLGKEDFFAEHVAGRQVVADMEVEGEVQGKSYLAVSMKDAIHLGGILIMLPPAELENVIKEEDFGEDARDAYGEIANIISGVYTAVFEEQYSQKLRFIRKELREVVPAKVDTASDEPLPDKNYYTSSMTMAVSGKPLGNMHMLFPAEMLRLDSPLEDTAQEAPTQTDENESAAPTQVASQKEQSLETAAAGGSGKGPSANTAALDIKKHQKRVDKILSACKDKMADEVSALLGTDVKLTHLENILVSKEEFFFDEVSGKQIIADMDVVGELEGTSYLSVGLRDAIRIGGALIMLPAAELESVVAEEEFGEDTQDAYGEIANIVAGVYTSVFEEQYTKRIRFVKTNLQQVAPMKVDIAADKPIPDQDYYLSRMDLTLGDAVLGKVHLLFPAELLQLSGLRQGSAAGDDNEETAAIGQAAFDQEKTDGQLPQRNESNGQTSLDILVIGDDEPEVKKIAAVLGNAGYGVKTLSFKDNLHNYIPGNLKAIYLVMRDVNEQAFGVAIKVSSSCSIPLIAAGPDWTRTKVIKAVKYGIRDILLTPASEEDISENVNSNLLELAA
jgi:chemotaxis protein CheY-P-specific phosphatase CheC